MVRAQIHFLSLNTEVDFSPGSPQFACGPGRCMRRELRCHFPGHVLSFSAWGTCERWCQSNERGLCLCRFLLADLGMINRTVTPWLVVNLHRPIYTSSASGKSYTSVLKVAEDLRLALEDLFFLYQVGPACACPGGGLTYMCCCKQRASPYVTPGLVPFARQMCTLLYLSNFLRKRAG